MDIHQLEIIQSAVSGACDIVDEPEANFIVITVDSAGITNVISTFTKEETASRLGATHMVFSTSIMKGLN